MKIKNNLLVRKIENGTVIDHIPVGKSLDVLKILGGPNNNIVILAMNVSSKHSPSERKDILKLENVYIPPEKLNLITLVAPDAKINIVVKSEVTEKRKVSLPEKIVGIIKCANPNCITNSSREPVKTEFIVSQKPVQLTCSHCGKKFPPAELF